MFGIGKKTKKLKDDPVKASEHADKKLKCLRILLLTLFLVIAACPVQASAADVAAAPGTYVPVPEGPIHDNTPVVRPDTLIANKINIAFNAIPARYSDMDPSTVFDLDGDLVGDISVGIANVTAKNGALIQYLDPAQFDMDQVYSVPTGGYKATAVTLASHIYVAKLPNGYYAKFIIVQSSPKVTIKFCYGKPTPSVLRANGEGSHAVLTWDPLPDAQLGYNVYRYEPTSDGYYNLMLLNDFTVKETTFTDNTAANHYYLYVVEAIKNNNGDIGYGSTTTVAPVFVQSMQCSLVITANSTAANLNGSPITAAAASVIKNGRLMIPASLLTNIGVNVTYVKSTNKLTLVRRPVNDVTYTVVMTVDVPQYTWNGTDYTSDVPPYTVGNEVFIPLRTVAPALGYGLSFNHVTTEATLSWFE